MWNDRYHLRFELIPPKGKGEKLTVDAQISEEHATPEIMERMLQRLCQEVLHKITPH